MATLASCVANPELHPIIFDVPSVDESIIFSFHDGHSAYKTFNIMLNSKALMCAFPKNYVARRLNDKRSSEMSCLGIQINRLRCEFPKSSVNTSVVTDNYQVLDINSAII